MHVECASCALDVFMTVIAAGGGSDDGFVRGEVRPTKKDLADAVMMGGIEKDIVASWD